MQTMQNFYDQLSSEAIADEGNLQVLAALTKMQPDELAELDEAVTWTGWNASD